MLVNKEKDIVQFFYVIYSNNISDSDFLYTRC